MTGNDEYVLEVLEENGVVTPEAVALARESMGAEGLSVVDVLVRNKTVTEVEVLRAVAHQFNMSVINLLDQELAADIIAQIPAEVARRYKVIPVFRSEDTLTVAIGDPLDVDTLDSLRYVLKRNVEGVVAPPEEIRLALERYYPVEADLATLVEKIDDGTADVDVAGMSEMQEQGDVTDVDAPIIRLVSLIILDAHRKRSSDIHLEPMQKRFRVRYRIDGMLHEVDSPPKRLQSAILSRVKLMAGMKLSEKRHPQDGRIEVKVQGRTLDLRVSSVPSIHGESIVMRILDKQSMLHGLPELGFLSDDQQTFERIIQLPDGIILVTGPTGSGKTTTLYACLNFINRPDRKIITVEDPVEYQLQGINQVMVHEDIGLTFASALRSILRQAPNIVMIGEIRDLETARIATEASLTGHLVFSTLHTNDAPSAIARLLDLGVKPFLVASSVRVTMAQRLVRSVCSNCREPYKPSEGELRLLGPAARQMAQAQLMHGRGCPDCSLTGYKGRKGIFEIFRITDEVQQMIFQKRPASELRTRARELGMRTLREDGLRKAATGMTTIEEVLRATMGDES